MISVPNQCGALLRSAPQSRGVQSALIGHGPLVASRGSDGEPAPQAIRTASGQTTGSLVADFHRTLLHGGVFLYPPTQKTPKGKLRLLYEANPLALIAEQAGGAATDGRQRILDKVPTSLHERTTLIIGSKDEVERVLSFWRG